MHTFASLFCSYPRHLVKPLVLAPLWKKLIIEEWVGEYISLTGHFFHISLRILHNGDGTVRRWSCLASLPRICHVWSLKMMVHWESEYLITGHVMAASSGDVFRYPPQLDPAFLQYLRGVLRNGTCCFQNPSTSECRTCCMFPCQFYYKMSFTYSTFQGSRRWLTTLGIWGFSAGAGALLVRSKTLAVLVLIIFSSFCLLLH